MNGFTVNELCEILNGKLVNYQKDLVINNFEFDPVHFNDNHPGNCFISISRERWNQSNKVQTNWIDGNKKILDHFHKCSLIITETPVEELKERVTQLIVDNSFAAIKKIAKAARKKMKNPVIGITGSVGKSTTRLMLEHLLEGKGSIVATRGNHNTQAGVPLYGAKLSRNPDFGILEISLNALNNRGNQSLVVRPDICIITSIGEAHLTTLHSTENIARFKARIIDGLTPEGAVILNKDINEKEFNILYNKAKEKTERIRTYSMRDLNADLYLRNIIHSKYDTKVQFHYKGKDYEYKIKMPGLGIIENSLAAFLCIAELGYPIDEFLHKMENFKSLDKVMDLKQIETRDGRKVDLLDDSHNAAVPSMKNAIETFKNKQSFYSGTKILALGQIADLGEDSQKLHDELVPLILSSGADYVFGHGKYMRKVIRQLPAEMVGGWFDNARDLARRIPMYCSNDSLVLLKGSFSGSDFRLTSRLLPLELKNSRKKLDNYDAGTIADVLQPAWGLAVYDLEEQEKKFVSGNPNSRAIEGLGPLILLYLLYKDGKPENQQVQLNKWPTNRGYSVTRKPFRTGTSFTTRELLEELKQTQHPSAIFELSYIYFDSRNRAMKKISLLSKSLDLTSCSTLNLTGRYRVKEQQAFTLEDLIKIGKMYYQQKELYEDLPVIFTDENDSEVKGILFGNVRKSAICYYHNHLICLTGLKSEANVETVIRDTLRRIKIRLLQ